jgi:hypothetical protein
VDVRHTNKLLAVGGLVGPAAFVADWAVLGARRAGYSPIHDAISRLAERGASTRPAMTAGFVAYGIGLITYGIALRQAELRPPGPEPGSSITEPSRAAPGPDPAGPGPAGYLAVATGITTLGVAAFPLGSQPSEAVHAVVAAVGYATLAGVPLAAANRAKTEAERNGAVLSGLVAATFLLASAAGAPRHGLTQRIGLTVGDAWVMISAAALIREPR